MEKQSLILWFLPILMTLSTLFGKIGAKNIKISDFSPIQFLDIFIMLGAAFLLIRGILWFFIVRRFDLVYSYSVMSLSYVLVLFASNIFFKEPVTFGKILGSVLIIAGVLSVSIGEKKKR